MSKLDTLKKQVTKLIERASPVVREPENVRFVVLNENGEDREGWQEHNQENSARARRRRRAVKEYLFDPDLEGIDP